MNNPNSNPNDSHVATLAYRAVADVRVSVFLFRMVAGVVFRAAQAQWLPIASNFFYLLMTLHGVGMTGVSGLGGHAGGWTFLYPLPARSLGLRARPEQRHLPVALC